MKIQLEPYIEELIDNIGRYTISSKQDVINWLVKERYSNFFFSNELMI
jgi:hypothetical protein